MSVLRKIFKRNNSYSHTNSNGVKYYLNFKDVKLRAGTIQRIYYFSRDYRAETATPLPKDFTIRENPRNGFLTVITPAMRRRDNG